jgi:hypothetical protein
MIRLRRWSVLCFAVVFPLLALASLFEPSTAWSQEKPSNKPEENKWAVDRSLVLTPHPEPLPALKYRLYPLASELKEGNSVPIYLRLVHEQNDEARRAWREKPAEWNKLPLDKLPVAEIRSFLEKHAYMMNQLDLGARRTTAEWNYTLDAGDPVGILLPDLQMMRVYAPLLILKARAEMAEKDYAAAAHTLETGFAIARQVSKSPFLIGGLVSIAIAAQVTEALADWVGQSDAPNLYWAIASLPRPLVDLRHQFDFEYRMIELQMPDLADLKRERTPGEWDAALVRVRTEMDRIAAITAEAGAAKPTPPPGARPTDPADRSPELPAARKYLTERLHVPANRVSTMPAAQILLLYIAAVTDEYRDDMYKGVNLPDDQALPVTMAADARFRQMKAASPNSEATRIPSFFMAALPKVVAAHARLERRVEMLRVLEALRLYAAAHDGQLPEKLSDITETPLSNDAGTGKPFEYHREGNTATLVAPTLGEFPTSALRYRVSVKSKG